MRAAHEKNVIKMKLLCFLLLLLFFVLNNVKKIFKSFPKKKSDFKINMTL